MTNFEDYFTDVILNDRYNYFVTSTISGLIHVWKFYATKTLVHTFKVHASKVTSLGKHPLNSTYIVSASNDSTIKILSLEKFSVLYSLNLQAGASYVKLLSETHFAMVLDST